ncbi:MAG: hypothetical protein LAN62_08745 [Acidobacteriia bacterium]|nr:hypothetical protein [Terriglobia bacterium]
MLRTQHGQPLSEGSRYGSRRISVVRVRIMDIDWDVREWLSYLLNVPPMG